MNRNLTATQSDYALFLPATSGFYSTFIGKQRYGNYVDPARIPASFKAGIESLNYLEPEKGEFYYKWCLYSAGHANLDLDKFDESEDMFRNRDRSTSWVLGDSGGFQIGKGVWPADWKDPNCPKAQKKRELVLRWMDELMDYGMCLDIPAWVARSPAGQAATGIYNYDDAVIGTYINNEYFIQNRTGACKFLNVLQGENHNDAERWYQSMKKFCDTSIYGDKAFNGWAMGGQNMCDAHLVLKRIVSLKFDNMLEPGQHDWMHFLGTSKLEWACFLTIIQRSVRKHINPNFTISYDCASPFLATANGQVYITTELENRSKWVYRMVPSVDNKKYSQDTRLFKDAVIQDGIFNVFDPSPLIDQVQIKDICIYGAGVPNWTEVDNDKIDHIALFKDPLYLNNPKYWVTMGHTNKINKVSRTSWDSFSYAILMGHNVWSHVNAVQRANQEFDNNVLPYMLIDEKFTNVRVSDIIDAIISCDDKDVALEMADKYSKLWIDIPGTRGNCGKKTINADTKFNEFYTFDNDDDEEEIGDLPDFTEYQAEVLFNLEDSIKDE
jgi:hypothetical protein